MENEPTEDVSEPVKRKLVNIYLDDDQLGEIVRFQQAMLLPTRMAAIRLLLTAGYQSCLEATEARLANQREAATLAKRGAAAV